MSWHAGAGGVYRAPVVIRPPPPHVSALVSVLGVTTVCTSGTWSTAITFVACDTFRVQIDGPAADAPKVSLTMELEET